MASEVGVLDIPPENIVRQGAAAAGPMFLVDTAQGRIVDDEEIKRELARGAAVRASGCSEHLVDIDDLPDGAVPARSPITRPCCAASRRSATRTKTCGCCSRRWRSNGEEPIGSMGTDTPLAVLSDRPRLLYDYFKQLFAQVTNPPLDAIREELVTSMESTIGPEGNLLEPRARSRAGRSAIKYPIIDNERAGQAAAHRRAEGSSAVTLPMLFDPRAGRRRASSARWTTCSAQASDAVDAGYTILILSDRGVEPRAARRSRACSRRPACTITWSARARARAARWSSNRATRAKCTTRAAARLRRRRGQSVPRVRDARRHDPAAAARRASRTSRRSSTTSRRSTRASSR